MPAQTIISDNQSSWDFPTYSASWDLKRKYMVCFNQKHIFLRNTHMKKIYIIMFSPLKFISSQQQQKTRPTICFLGI